jgi:hypothetical protein
MRATHPPAPAPFPPTSGALPSAGGTPKLPDRGRVLLGLKSG